MNERILDICIKAGINTWPFNEVGFISLDESELEKFAELIVKDCARTASMFSVENKRIHPDIDPKDMPLANQMVYHSTCQCVAQEIKELFGVE